MTALPTAGCDWFAVTLIYFVFDDMYPIVPLLSLALNQYEFGASKMETFNFLSRFQIAHNFSCSAWPAAKAYSGPIRRFKMSFAIDAAHPAHSVYPAGPVPHEREH